MRPLEHQLSRFGEGDSMLLRADIEFRMDELVSIGAPVEFGLFALDSSLNIISESRDTVRAIGRVASGHLETRLAPGAYGYSVEAREVATGLAARSRHPLPSASRGDLAISDLVLLPAHNESPTRGEAGFSPFGSLLLGHDQELALYLEVRGLVPDEEGRVHYQLELQVVEGREGAGNGARISWVEEAPGAATLPVTVDLGRLSRASGLRRLVGGLLPFIKRSGLQRLILTVTDLTSGASATTERLVKIE
jgi:hypothetical protein